MFFPVVLTLGISLVTGLLTAFVLSPLILILPVFFLILLSTGNYFLVARELPKKGRNVSNAPLIVLFLNLIYLTSLLIGWWLWSRAHRDFVLEAFFLYALIPLAFFITVGAFFLQRGWHNTPRLLEHLVISYFALFGVILLFSFLLLSGLL